METGQRRGFNSLVTRFWSFAAPAYDLPFLQHWVYRPAHDEVIAQLRAHQSRKVADIACGTGILTDRIDRKLHPDELYGVDMSDGMLNQARARSTGVNWLRGPAEHLPFDDGALDAVVTTSAFHFFDQAAALRELHRVLASCGLVAVAALSARQPLLQGPSSQVETGAPRVGSGDADFVRERRVRRPRAASGPAGRLDADCVGLDHRRHQARLTGPAPATPSHRHTTFANGVVMSANAENARPIFGSHRCDDPAGTG